MTFYMTPATASFDMSPEEFGYFPMRRQQHRNISINPFEQIAMMASGPQMCRRRSVPICRRQVVQKPQDFSTAISVRGFQPEEVTVETDKETRMVKVVCNSEQKNEEGTVVSKRQFERSFKVPESCNMEAIVSKRLEDGTMKIMAPANAVVPEEKKAPAVEDDSDKPILEEKTQEEIQMDVEKENGEEKEEEQEDSLFDAEINASGNDFVITVSVGSTTKPEELSLEMRPESRGLSVKAKENVRTFTIPEKFDLEKMNSTLDQESGVLKIVAPLKKSEEKRSIPINMK